MMRTLRSAVVCIALLVLVSETTADGRCNKPSRRGEHGPCPAFKLNRDELGELYSPPSCKNPCPNTAPNHSNALYCINAPDKTCNDKNNKDCPPCGLYKKIAGCSGFHYSSIEGTTYPHWIILPCSPVSGIESILDGTKASDTNFLWEQAWNDATNGNKGKLSKAEVGLVMNSFFYRSQHQMHIHVARIMQNFITNCLKTLPATVQNKWSAPSGCSFQTLSIHTDKFSDINGLIEKGAKQLENSNGVPSTQVGAMVSGNLSNYNKGKGYLVTVFRGDNHHGDHDILEYPK